MPRIGRSPDAVNTERIEAPGHGSARSLGRDALLPPLAPDRVPEHRCPGFGIEFEVHGADHSAVGSFNVRIEAASTDCVTEHDSERRKSIPRLSHVYGDELLS